MQTALRQLPAVSKLLGHASFRGLVRRHGRSLVTGELRRCLDELRERIRRQELAGRELRRACGAPALAASVDARITELLEPRPRRVINATGVVVHTNLGRSVLSAEAAARVAAAARGYLDLEYDTGSGRRGSRGSHLSPLMERLFPGHDFVVVNNNAAATMLALRALARGKQVIVSRGELVEIGGSFRVPDILAASGARLREVGTTNRTRLSDYRQAIGERTGALLKVHTSNFKVVGFTAEASVAQLSGLAAKHDLPLIVDWGSGDLVDLAPLKLRDERPVSALLDDGADVVTFSGDKLLGGPQAGFAVGRGEVIARLKKDPLARVCRLDRLQIAALHATLAAYVCGREFEDVPTLKMLKASATQIGRRAQTIRKSLADDRVKVVSGVSRTGGGSSPTGERPTRLLSVDPGAAGAAALERSLRETDPPIVARVQNERVLLDLRTVDPADDDLVRRRLAELL